MIMQAFPCWFTSLSFCTLIIVTVLYSNEKHEKIIKGFYFATLTFGFYNCIIYSSLSI